MKKKSKLEQLFELMAGEYIQVLLNIIIEDVEQKEDSIKTSKHPITTQGYLVEEDDEYIFIGPTPESISQAIKKEFIVHIEVGQTSINEEDFDPVMLDMEDMPEDKGKFN